MRVADFDQEGPSPRKYATFLMSSAKVISALSEAAERQPVLYLRFQLSNTARGFSL